MAITFWRHVPGFVEVEDEFRKPRVFETQDELLSDPWIAEWSKPAVTAVKDGTTVMPFTGFHLWYEAFSWPGRGHLMAVWGNNQKWWVVGVVDQRLDLPIWSAPKELAHK